MEVFFGFLFSTTRTLVTSAKLDQKLKKRDLVDRPLGRN